ncbi:hypothetical protein Clacol_010251 [Clathrus columnatus]|uniref:Peptidase S53 activation domain-containing protein n=1 Tax=Clathrus columnatus TaxID=1419009 RepID=A0AAV5AQD2_9AGAM|nr:hypothetical protein Clacol_010251 [Clathrus columnatus]
MSLSILPTLKVHEISNVPSHFEYVRPANSFDKVELQVILHSRDIKGLERALYRVSDPSSDYGQHLTKQEVKFVPLKSVAREPLIFKLFAADFSEYLNNETGERVIRTTSYSLPENVSPFISSVHPTVVFPLPQRKTRRHDRQTSLLKARDRSNGISLDCLGDLFSVSCGVLPIL